MRIAHLETLAALAEQGTMTRAATRLRLTQSAVSKRIAALEAEAGRKLVEADGRRVRLTAAGSQLVESARPHLAALQELLGRGGRVHGGRVSLAVSESVLASWGPRLLARAHQALPEVELRLHAHRSPVAIDRVRAGECRLALVAGRSDGAPDLRVVPLLDEEMVLVPSGLRSLRLRRDRPLPVITIEPRSGTYRSLRVRWGRLETEAGIRLEIEQTLESFAGVVQLARHGFGHALVPWGIARALGVAAARLVPLPAPGLRRPVSLVARPSTLVQEEVSSLLEAIQDAASRLPADTFAPG